MHGSLRRGALHTELPEAADGAAKSMDKTLWERERAQSECPLIQLPQSDVLFVGGVAAKGSLGGTPRRNQSHAMCQTRAGSRNKAAPTAARSSRADRIVRQSALPIV